MVNKTRPGLHSVLQRAPDLTMNSEVFIHETHFTIEMRYERMLEVKMSETRDRGHYCPEKMAGR